MAFLKVQQMTKAAKRKSDWIVGLALLCGAAVIIPSIVSFGISVFQAVTALIS